MRTFNVAKTARVVHLTNEDKANETLLIALHGYSQLSTFFSNKFQALLPLVDVLVPEGLSRFYQQGSSGRVGASWMTSEEREIDISDNHKYLQQLVNFYAPSYKHIVLFGFSQGGATALRYFMEDKRVSQIIVSGTDFPSGISKSEIMQDNRKKDFILGTKDPYFNMTRQKEVLILYAQNNFKSNTFDGGHEINLEILKNCLQ